MIIHEQVKLDPTKTTNLRKQFSAEMYKRFRRLKGLVRKALIEQNALALNAEGTTLGYRAFEFERSGNKVAAFMGWLDDMEQREIFEVKQGVPQTRAAEASWVSTYIKSAYHRGIQNAAQKIDQSIPPSAAAGLGITGDVSESLADTAFSRPVHADRVGLLYTRAYNELKGITDAMDQQISRTLAQGMAEGKNPREIARQINDRIDAIGITRARTLARTEIINAHSEGALNTYEEAHVEGVEVEAEFTTAGDARVCQECQSLEGNIYSIEEARGLIPVHPDCRCAWLPVVDTEQ